ncbi:MAG: hypothetical protein WA728_33705, partial [Xanthobacteraceae bacterium]
LREAPNRASMMESDREKASSRNRIPGDRHCGGYLGGHFDSLGAGLWLLGHALRLRHRYLYYSGPYAPAPYAAPPAFYGYDPYGTVYNWDYYRVDRPGRGNNVESTR